MNKPAKSYPRAIGTLVHKTLGQAFAKQGFASAELVTRWADIAGAEVAAHSQPERIQWPRGMAGEPPGPGTLVLRVQGPTALEIQHLSGLILERVNRFFGWKAVGTLRLRQAPLGRKVRALPAAVDPAATALLAATLSAVHDDKLRDALARLGASVKGS
ncbi:MAG: DUF721 domain-containing protein [Xanthobacteraceae bacterium]